MSLEEEISKLTVAITGLTSITEKLTSLRADAIEAVKKDAAPAPKATTTKAADKPKEEEKPSGVDHAAIRAAMADYIGATDRENERAARKTKLKELLNHAKIKKEGVETATSSNHIAEGSVGLFLDQVAKLKAKGDLTEPEKAAADDLDL